MIDHDRLAELLSQSRAAHARKKECVGRVGPGGRMMQSPDYPLAEQHIAEALRLREEADALDPEHRSPVWSRDRAANKGVSHGDLVAFFRKYATIP